MSESFKDLLHKRQLLRIPSWQMFWASSEDLMRQDTKANQRRRHMSKIVRYDFMGSWIYFWLLCITGIGIPFALLYLLNGTIQTHTEVSDPERFVQEFRAGKMGAA